MRLSSSAAVLVAGALLGRGETSAAAGARTDAARRAGIVARVGSRAILVGEVEDRILAMPPFQRATFGDTPAAIRHRFVSDVVVRDALLLLGAEADGVERKLPSAYAVDRARSSGTIRAIRARVGPASSIPMDDVRAYYESNRARYESPARIQIWRILCATRDEAQTVLDLAATDAGPKGFTDLARDHSLDKATRLRGGNVGFVTEDGASNEPGLQVDPAVVQAAETVHDGQLVPHPVPEGDAFAVVWRRGTLAASKRTVQDVTLQVREALWETRVKSETDALVARLRAENVRGLNEGALEGVEVEIAGRRGLRGTEAEGGR